MSLFSAYLSEYRTERHGGPKPFPFRSRPFDIGPRASWAGRRPAVGRRYSELASLWAGLMGHRDGKPIHSTLDDIFKDLRSTDDLCGQGNKLR